MARSIKWIITVIVFVLAAAAVLSFAAPHADNAADALRDSIRCEDGTVSFTIPDGHRIWNLLISGRILADGSGMSVHYLEGTEWENGASYSFDVSGGSLDELLMSVSVDGRESVIDLIPYLPAELLAA